MNIIKMSSKLGVLSAHSRMAEDSRKEFLGMPFDLISQKKIVSKLSKRVGGEDYKYIVTPNVQHVLDVQDRPEYSDVFRSAWFSLCDSRPIRRLASFEKIDLPLVTGSDLTQKIFTTLLKPDDHICAIASSQDLADNLRKKYPAYHWRFHIPPTNTTIGSKAYDECVDFVATSKSRFCFIALGAPKSERIAEAASHIEGATGTALCIGASLEFITGSKVRAPKFIQQLGMEWAYRLSKEPKRLWRRYLMSILPLFRVFIENMYSKQKPQ